LIAAYVLALQTILGSVAPRLTVAFDTTLPFDLAAICLSSHGAGVGPAADIPGGSGNGSQAGDHCAICVSSTPPLLAAPDGVRIAIDFATSEPFPEPPGKSAAGPTPAPCEFRQMAARSNGSVASNATVKRGATLPRIVCNAST